MENKPKHYFYVLQCADNTFYAGYTTEPARRLKEHNSGTGAKYTHPPKRRPAKMIHLESFDTRSKATKAEYAFKQLTRPQKEVYLQKQSPDKNLSDKENIPKH